MNRIAGLVLLLVVFLPDAADAQRRGTRYNQFSFSPYVGVYKDAYDIGADDSDLGWMVGFKAEYHESSRLTLHANLGYAESNDVATRVLSHDPVYDNQWVILTGGAAFALVPGNTSIAVGADAGVAWRQTDAPDNLTGASAAGEGWGAYEVIVPTLSLRHRFTQRTSVYASLHDYISDVLEGNAQHSPALTVGMSFR